MPNSNATPARNLPLMVVCASLLVAACNPVVNFFAFHPDNSYAVPTSKLPSETREVFFDAEDGVRIHALELRHLSADALTIYFHGNAGNVYHRLRDLQRLRRLGTSVLAVSYRGYGKSAGSPDEEGIYLDAKAAFEHATKSMGYVPSRIYLFGRSLGSTTATNLAQGKDLAGVILISPLSSAAEQAEAMGLGFAASLAGNAFDNATKIKRLKAPLLVVHGTLDQVIPIATGRRVFENATGEKSFIAVEGAGHNDLSNRFAKQYWPVISDFMKRTTPRATDSPGANK